MTVARPIGFGSRGRSGFSLLEVLVAAGILVLALSGIAAMLPAATARLSQAAGEDRAGWLARNAIADFLNRGMASSILFTDTQSPVFGFPIAVFGPLNEDRNNNATLDAGEDLNGNGLLDPPNEDANNDRVLNGSEDANGNGVLDRPPYYADVSGGAVDQRISRVRGFQLEDELRYAPSLSRDLPTNSFQKNGALGIREYNDGTCWAAMLASQVATPVAGSPAILSVAVFRKLPSATMVNLYAPDSLGDTARKFSLFRGDSTATPIAGTMPQRMADEALRKRFLAPGSYVLLLANNGALQTPTWLRVTSSWTTTAVDPAARKSYVMLSAAPSLLFRNPGVGGAMFVRAIAYEGLLRVEQVNVTLQ